MAAYYHTLAEKAQDFKLQSEKDAVEHSVERLEEVIFVLRIFRPYLSVVED